MANENNGAESGGAVPQPQINVIGQYINILALKAGEASAIAPLDYARLVFVVFLGLWMFDEWPEPRVFVGAAVIIAAAIYTLHRERIVGRSAARNTSSGS